MRRSEGLLILTRCSDAQGRHWFHGQHYTREECLTCDGTDQVPWLRCFSQYGATSRECAPVAWRVAYLIARECGEEITEDSLQHAMGLVVNDHPDVAYLVRNYGHRMYV